MMGGQEKPMMSDEKRLWALQTHIDRAQRIINQTHKMAQKGKRK